MLSVGVLASGSGTNLASLLAASADGALQAKIAVVICNVPGAKALERAEAAGVPAVLVDHRAHPTKDAFEAEVQRQLEAHGVELVALAGFMRILSEGFVKAWHGRLLNIHPSLLPAFPGMHAVRQALEAGVRFAGCTVHLVDEGTDTGPIVAQAAVSVAPDDDEASLHAKIQQQEHRLFPWVVNLFAEEKVRLDGRAIHLDVGPEAWASLSLCNPGPVSP